MKVSALEEDDKIFIEKIYCNYFPIMYKCAYSYMKDDAMARDVIHNAVCKLFNKVSKLKTFDENYLISYVFLTVKSVSLDTLKSSQNIVHLSYSDEAIVNEFLNGRLDPEVCLFEAENYGELIDRIKNLPEKKKNILYMKYMLEMDNAQIAKAAGISDSNLRVLIHRIKKEILKPAK